MLELWGPPWGKADEETAVVVHQVNQGVLSHYGHAGPRFVQHLLRYRPRWEQWREEYQFALATYTAKAGGDPVAGRLAEYFATLDQTAVIAHEALELPWEYQDPIADLWDSLVREASQADRAAAALASVLSWATGHEQEFWGRHSQDQDGTPRQPHTGWAGKWERDEKWSEIAFLPHRLSEILKSQGFESEAILRVWRDREWLTVGDDHARCRKKISIAGNKCWAVVIKREAFEEGADGKSPRGTGGTEGEP